MGFLQSCRSCPLTHPNNRSNVIQRLAAVHFQEGVYRYERHPAYLGAMLWGLGIQVGLDQCLAEGFSSYVMFGVVSFGIPAAGRKKYCPHTSNCIPAMFRPTCFKYKEKWARSSPEMDSIQGAVLQITRIKHQ